MPSVLISREREGMLQGHTEKRPHEDAEEADVYKPRREV